MARRRKVRTKGLAVTIAELVAFYDAIAALWNTIAVIKRITA